MPELWTAVALFVAVAAVFFILWRIAALHAATKDLPSGIESALAEKHRAMLSDLHAGLNSQGDRLLSQSAESGERQKTLAELNAPPAKRTSCAPKSRTDHQFHNRSAPTASCCNPASAS